MSEEETRGKVKGKRSYLFLLSACYLQHGRFFASFSYLISSGFLSFFLSFLLSYFLSSVHLVLFFYSYKLFLFYFSSSSYFYSSSSFLCSSLSDFLLFSISLPFLLSFITISLILLAFFLSSFFSSSPIVVFIRPLPYLLSNFISFNTSTLSCLCYLLFLVFLLIFLLFVLLLILFLPFSCSAIADCFFLSSATSSLLLPLKTLSFTLLTSYLPPSLPSSSLRLSHSLTALLSQTPSFFHL